MLIRNSGKSFAKDVRVAARVRVVPKGGLPDYSNEKTTEWESRGLLPPDTLFTPVASVAFLPDQPLALTQEQLRDINAGAVTIFVSGKIWYDDVFDRAHWTTFCFFLIPGSNGVFQAYREHNEADSDR